MDGKDHQDQLEGLRLPREEPWWKPCASCVRWLRHASCGVTGDMNCTEKDSEGVISGKRLKVHHFVFPQDSLAIRGDVESEVRIVV